MSGITSGRTQAAIQVRRTQAKDGRKKKIPVFRPSRSSSSCSRTLSGTTRAPRLHNNVNVHYIPRRCVSEALANRPNGLAGWDNSDVRQKTGYPSSNHASTAYCPRLNSTAFLAGVNCQFCDSASLNASQLPAHAMTWAQRRQNNYNRMPINYLRPEARMPAATAMTKLLKGGCTQRPPTSKNSSVLTPRLAGRCNHGHVLWARHYRAGSAADAPL